MSNQTKFVAPAQVDHARAVNDMQHNYNNYLNKSVIITDGNTKTAGVLIGLDYDDTDASAVKAFQIRDPKTQEIIEIPFQTEMSIQEEMQK